MSSINSTNLWLFCTRQIVCYALVDVKPEKSARGCSGKEGRQGFNGRPNRKGTRGIRPARRQGWREGAGEGSYESPAHGDRAESGGSAVGVEGLANYLAAPHTLDEVRMRADRILQRQRVASRRCWRGAWWRATRPAELAISCNGHGRRCLHAWTAADLGRDSPVEH